MKKILLSLLLLNGMAIANNLPQGEYDGNLKTPRGVNVHGHGNSNPAGIKVDLDYMPDLASTGHLTADINLSVADCFNGTGMLVLDHGIIKKFDITASECTLNGNIFSGNYHVTGISWLHGTFSFVKQ